MAYVANEVFRQSFTDSNRIIVAHNTDLEYPAVRLIVNDEARPDLILAIQVDAEDPTNRLLVNLRSTQTGIIQVLNYDFQPVGVFSATLLAVRGLGVRLNFGTEYNYIEDLPEASTVGQAFAQRLRLNVNVPTGNYRLSVSFTWRYSSTSNNFLARMQEDDTVTIWTMTQEPQDTGADQQTYAYGVVEGLILTPGPHFYDLDFASSSPGGTSTIGQARMEFWRL